MKDGKLMKHGIRESVDSPPSAQSPEQLDLPLELACFGQEAGLDNLQRSLPA